MLNGKKILVVGGGSGIGYAVAKQARDSGAIVIIASRSANKLNLAAQSLGSAVKTEQVDVLDESSVRQLFERLGTIDHLVATIKPTLPAKPFLEDDFASVKLAFDTKFWGQCLLAKHGAQSIAPGGSITLTSGIGAHRSYPGFAAVAAMNAATEAISKSLAVELAPIRVNTVCPGFVDTVPATPGRAEHIMRIAPTLPLERLGNPDEIAQTYLYVMCNTYSTGSVVIVDGGALC
jgi:NAD(P)-dependent dehydrogenase (short-subunit alcohol dehydrogenase family)